MEIESTDPILNAPPKPPSKPSFWSKTRIVMLVWFVLLNYMLYINHKLALLDIEQSQQIVTLLQINTELIDADKKLQLADNRVQTMLTLANAAMKDLTKSSQGLEKRAKALSKVCGVSFSERSNIRTPK